MAPTIAIAGGSTGLGRAIVEALKEDGRYNVIVLSRKENPTLAAQINVPILAANYASIDALTTLLEAHNVWTLISTANSLVDATPEFNMIQAADRSSATQRFIPNAWSAIEFKDEPRFHTLPLATTRLAVLSSLRATNLQWTAIYPGLFLETVVPYLPSYTKPTPLMLDVAHNTAALPYTGTAPIALTYTRDIARYIPHLLALSAWEQRYSIAADVRTWNEIVAAAERGKGVKFEVVYDSKEKLERGEVTELEGYKEVCEAFGGWEVGWPVFKGVLARYGGWMEEGLFKGAGGTRLGEVFPEVEVVTLEGAWKMVKGG